MLRSLLVFFLLSSVSGWLLADCAGAIAELKLPIKLRAGGKPRTARWEQVEKSLTKLRETVREETCELRFDQVFLTSDQEIYFPLIGNLLRTAPEDSLEGLTVFAQDGSVLGQYENRVTFEKKGEYNYTQYYFQFRDGSGKLQSSGNRILIDIGTQKPLFLVRWQELRGRLALSNP